MLRLEVLTPEAFALAPRLCAVLEETSFVLAGGTGLALQLGHRVSMDFDWFCRHDAFPHDLAGRLDALASPLTVIQDSVHTFECLMGVVRCAFFAYEPRFAPAAEQLYGRPIAPIADIAAMKLLAVSQRGAKKDFFDLYAILQAYEFRDIVRRGREMLAGTPVNPVHIAKSLAYFDDAEGEPDPRMLSHDTWESVRTWFVRHAREYTDILMREL